LFSVAVLTMVHLYDDPFTEIGHIAYHPPAAFAVSLQSIVSASTFRLPVHADQ
jgi:hypothetical protein